MPGRFPWRTDSPPLVQEQRDQDQLNHNGRQMRFKSSKLAWTVAAVTVVCAVAVIWVVASDSPVGDPGAANPKSAAVDYDEALAGAPPALAELYANGDALIPGGQEALDEQLAALEGHPVVVNVWASWCGPCRAEFPHFQSVSAERGDEMAFLGVDAQDSDAAAETFLEDYPLPYPSITDPDREIWNELGLRGLPGTAFYDSRGELAYLKQGPYLSEEDLVADVERYAR